MAATTDYDAPRRSTLKDEADTESLDALTTAQADKQSPVVDLDEGRLRRKCRAARRGSYNPVHAPPHHDNPSMVA